MTSQTEGEITDAILAEIFTERCHLRDQLGYDVDDDDKEAHGQIAIAAAARILLALPLFQDADPFEERRCNLILAAAMLVTEIERLDRTMINPTRVAPAKGVDHANESISQTSDDASHDAAVKRGS